MGEGDSEKVVKGCYDFRELIWLYVRQVDHRGDLPPQKAHGFVQR